MKREQSPDVIDLLLDEDLNEDFGFSIPPITKVKTEEKENWQF